MLSVIVPELHKIIETSENRIEMRLKEKLDEIKKIVFRELLYKRIHSNKF